MLSTSRKMRFLKSFSIMDYLTLIISSAMVMLIAFILNKLKKASPNPFNDRFVRQPGPIELDKVKRDKVLKQGFKPEKIPENLDAIVIGSGMGGLVAAGCLSRAGKRVLVLEQHDRAGGSTHTYEEKGFEFDIGLHYVGNMQIDSMNHILFDVMSDGQLTWEKLDEEYDAVVLPDTGTNGHKFIKLKAGSKCYEQRLLEYFPNEKRAIKEFMALVRQSERAIVGYTLMKQLPVWLIKVLNKMRLFNLIFARYDYMTQTSLQQVLDKITTNEELKVVLSYCFGDYGSFPSETPAMLHGVLIGHFYNGGYYPRGGSSEIAYRMIPGIERSGGAVLVRAPVSEILVDKGKVCGVCVKRNENSHKIFAPIVISTTGLWNTYHNLLPSEISSPKLKDMCRKVDRGLSCFQVLVGLRGTGKELGLVNRNYWNFTSLHPERDMKAFLKMNRDEAANVDVPLIFISFPSAKDSSWESRYPGKSVCVIVTFLQWEWFEEWEQERVNKRGHVYADLKKAFQDRIWESALKVFPQLADKVEYIESGSPLSHKYYLGCPRGDIYGVDHTLKRFQSELGTGLRTETDIKGLYLSGQDTFTCGVTGAAISGMVTSGAVLGRSHLSDIYQLMAKRKMERIARKVGHN